MTELLYYTDPDLLSFEAGVLSSRKDKKHLLLVLDRTAFYPEGGGQPADQGTLNGLRVLDVEKMDGDVVHRLQLPSGGTEIPKEGDRVEGLIDGEHRLDYMQQHSGQHVISAAMMTTAAIATVSVHQGADFTAIETSEEEIAEELLYRIEDEANRAIRASVPIESHWTDAEGLSAFSLRRPSKHSSNIRIIEIPGIDCVACGGMHLKNTAELGLIKYIRQEKIRGQIRTFWKIGRRAYEDYREKTEIINRLGTMYSARQHEIIGKADAAAAANSALNFEYGRLQREYCGLYADKLLSEAETLETGTRLIVSREEDRDKGFTDKLLKQLSVSEVPLVALILNRTDGKTIWAVTASEPASGDGNVFDFGLFRSDVLPLAGGKGGGKPPIWQGNSGFPGRPGRDDCGAKDAPPRKVCCRDGEDCRLIPRLSPSRLRPVPRRFQAA